MTLSLTRLFRPLAHKLAVAASLATLGITATATPATAQQMATTQGQAMRVDYTGIAKNMSMRDPYNRALYLFIRNNPQALD